MAADGNDNFCIELNCGADPLLQRQHQREVEHGFGSVLVLSNGEPGTVTCNGTAKWRSVYVPRARLAELVRNPEDLIARPIDICRPIVRHFRRYVGLVLQPSGVDPMLEDHVAATLVDLVALCLGAGREQAALAQMRGLRRARLAEILAEIKSGFADSTFSAAMVALKLGLTPRYVQDLLHESGQTFSERVLELRLQKARAMLASREHDHLRVNEIAYACGFSDTSHFNRCFRLRFGTTPTALRGAVG